MIQILLLSIISHVVCGTILPDWDSTVLIWDTAQRDSAQTQLPYDSRRIYLEAGKIQVESATGRPRRAYPERYGMQEGANRVLRYSNPSIVA